VQVNCLLAVVLCSSTCDRLFFVTLLCLSYFGRFRLKHILFAYVVEIEEMLDPATEKKTIIKTCLMF
jgi:hypothetical protein